MLKFNYKLLGSDLIMLIMYVTIIIIYTILINLFKKNNNKVDYLTLEKENNLIKLYRFIKLLNISIIIIDFIYYSALFLLKNSINLIYCIINFLLIILSIIYSLKLNYLINIKKNNFNYTLLNEYEYKYKLIYIYNIVITFILYKRIGEIHNFSILSNSLLIFLFLIIIDIIILIKYLIKNKKIVCFNINKEKDYIENINFNSKIELSNFYNYIIYISMYIILIYCNLPFSYLFYNLTIAVILIIIKKKVKRIRLEQEKIEKNIIFAKNKPGIVNTFLFYREIEFIKNIFITTLFITLSLVSFYTLDEIIFSYISIQLYILLIYEIFISKKKLINLLSELDENFIDKNEYNIDQIKKITHIKKVFNLFFKNKFYKLIYIDNNNIIYKSEIILYDPKLYINKIKIYFNSKNINDYIIVLEELYE